MVHRGDVIKTNNKHKNFLKNSPTVEIEVVYCVFAINNAVIRIFLYKFSLTFLTNALKEVP